MGKASKEKVVKKKGSKFKLIVSVIITVALFLAELYVMITAPANMIAVIGIGAGILLTAGLAVSAALDFVDERTGVNKEYYESIYKSEKTSYLLLKKRLEALPKQVQALEKQTGKTDNSSAEIIKAQKSIAKVMMGKNKESQELLFVELNNLEASLNDSVHDLSKRLSGFQEEIERLADHIAKINTEAIREAAQYVQTAQTVNVLNESVEEEIEAKEEDVLVDDILDSIGLDFEEEPIIMEESIEEELEVEPAPVVQATMPADDGGKMDQDDIAALIASMTGGDAEPVEESESIPEPVSIPVAAPADDGGKMDQDDIAALIASMTGGDAEPAEEPEPTSLPVDDNPNRMMTPEEIEALLASM